MLVLPCLGAVLADLRLNVWQCCAIGVRAEAVSSSRLPREENRRQRAISKVVIKRCQLGKDI